MLSAKDSINNAEKESCNPIKNNSHNISVSGLESSMKRYFISSRYEDAIKIANLLLLAHPEDSAIWRNKGTCHYALKEYDLAIQCLNKALIIEPNNSEILTDLGNYYYLSGKYSEAVKVFESLFALDPHNINAIRNCALSYFKMSKFDRALDTLNRIEKQSLYHLAALEMKAACYIHLNKLQEAREYLLHAVQINPESILAWHYKAECHLRLEEYYHASFCYLELIKIKPSKSTMLNNVAITRFLNQQYEEALEAIDNSIEIDKYCVSSWYLKMQCHIKLAQHHEIIECASYIANCIRPKDPYVWNQKALSYLNIRDISNAFNCFDYVLLNIDSENQDALYGKAQIYLYAQDYQNALMLVTKLIESAPENIEYNLIAAECHMAFKHYQKALDLYNKASLRNHYDFEILQNKIKCYNKLKQYEKSIECYQELILMDPTNVNLIIQQSICYAKLGNYEYAMNCYNRASELFPNDAYVSYFRSYNLFNLGLIEESIKSYDELLNKGAPRIIHTLCHVGKFLCFIALDKHQDAIDFFSNSKDAFLNLDKNAHETINQVLIENENLFSNLKPCMIDILVSYLLSMPSGTESLMKLSQFDCIRAHNKYHKVLEKIDIVDEYKARTVKVAQISKYAKEIANHDGETVVINGLSKTSMLFACHLVDKRLSKNDMENLASAIYNSHQKHGDIMNDPIYAHINSCFIDRIMSYYVDELIEECTIMSTMGEVLSESSQGA